ncbi:MAG: molybdenum cofactor guanylyltransferase [Synergistetes bacterium]|nr:molybdenum cofactor guanylyltransferase [Synergistota bacterium]
MYPVSLIVLAGGKSRRMGVPKSVLRISGKMLIEYIIESIGGLFEEIVMVVKAPPYPVSTYYRIVFDRYENSAPLIGIFTGLKEVQNCYAFVIGVDMPFVVPGLVEYLISIIENEDVVVPVVRGFYEPLLAVYSKSILNVIEERIRTNDLKVSSLYDSIHVCEVPESRIREKDPQLLSFLNLNTPRDVSFHYSSFP